MFSVSALGRRQENGKGCSHLVRPENWTHCRQIIQWAWVDARLRRGSVRAGYVPAGTKHHADFHAEGAQWERSPQRVRSPTEKVS